MPAGSEIDDHEMNSTDPAITACQAGKRIQHADGSAPQAEEMQDSVRPSRWWVSSH
jgi:uncharacterized protein YjaG (DUF416 family)